MPDFLPFRAIRYAGGPVIDAVCAPPYDVIDARARDMLLAADPHNAVRLILPDDYAGAATALRDWRATGVLVTDERPALYPYRMTYEVDNARCTTTGLFGALDHSGRVLPHEQTLPKAKSDRLQLLRATRANLDPVWVLSLAPGLRVPTGELGPPIASATDEEGALHELWRIDDEQRIATIHSTIVGGPFVLADGHHRFETARTYFMEHGGPGAAAIMALLVPLDGEDVHVEAIHRLLSGITATPALRDRLTDAFDVLDAGENTPATVARLAARMTDEGGLGLVDRSGLALLLPRPALEAKLVELPEPLRNVDAVRYAWGVPSDLGAAGVEYRHDAHAVAATVGAGRADAAVLLRPVTVDQIRDAAAAAVQMPPKTTFFRPKPRTGMVFRSLDD